ncbi:MAG: hypothetical protein J0I41_16520 [Filimonas sp.]|nr:hypothetical protein [Filimonas sp.]
MLSIDKVLQIVSDVEIKMMDRSLRRIMLGYFASYYDNLPVDFENILKNIEVIFDLLDALDNNSSKKAL